MVVFFDEYKNMDHMLLETMRCAVPDCRALVLKEDPFLPPHMMSLYEYYANKYETAAQKERDVFYVFLDIPEFWEVRPEGVNGAIFNQGKKMATIYFKEPLEKRNVQRIEWNTESGCVYKIDYYNRYGFVYCTAFLNSAGTEDARSYYTSEHKEVININRSNGVVTLFEEGHAISLFATVEEFEIATMKEVMDEKTHIVLTSNRQARWMTELGSATGQNIVIALQSEEDVKECQIKQFHQQLQCPLLVFNNFDTSKCSVEYTKNEFRICYSTFSYPDVKGTSEVLILTASDILFGIEYLVKSLPEVNFHIAANTLVSQKLIDMSARNNVYIYPQIKETELQCLYEKCDFYLDINYGREIHNAVARASLNNMLILGYGRSLHNKYYLLEECIFEEEEEEWLAQKITYLINNRGELERLTTKQQEKVKESIKHITG